MNNTDVRNSLMDEIDRIGLILERMEQLNNIVSDYACGVCNLDGNVEERLNAYTFVQRQPRIMVMTYLQSDSIDELKDSFENLTKIYAKIYPDTL